MIVVAAARVRPQHSLQFEIRDLFSMLSAEKLVVNIRNQKIGYSTGEICEDP